MILTRVILLLLLVVFTKILDALSNSENCNVCRSRNFDKQEACICPERQFCNSTSEICDECGKCFNMWDKITTKDKDNIETILQTLIKRYEIDLDELRKLLNLLQENIKRQEDESRKLGNAIYRSNSTITNVSNRINIITNNIKKIQEELEKLKLINPFDIQPIINHLNEINHTIMSWDGSKESPFENNYKDRYLQLNTKLTNVGKEILNTTHNFPDIRIGFLNLNLQIENDLNLLESMLSKFNNTTPDNIKFPQNIENSLKWIENDLLILFDLIKNYYKYSPQDTEDLIRNATNLKTVAETTKSRLEQLLNNHEIFEYLLNLLRNEIEYYKKIGNIQKQLDDIEKRIKELYQKLQELDKLKNVAEEVNNFNEAKNNFNNKIKKLQKYNKKMDKLLKEESELVSKLNCSSNFKTIEELNTEIEQMINEVRNITTAIEENCGVENNQKEDQKNEIFKK